MYLAPLVGEVGSLVHKEVHLFLLVVLEVLGDLDILCLLQVQVFLEVPSAWWSLASRRAWWASTARWSRCISSIHYQGHHHEVHPFLISFDVQNLLEGFFYEGLSCHHGDLLLHYLLLLQFLAELTHNQLL